MKKINTITVEDCVKVIKQNRRLEAITKHTLYDFLKRYMRAEVTSRTHKKELVAIAESLLRPDSIDIFTEYLEGFGLVRKDIITLGMPVGRFNKQKEKNTLCEVAAKIYSTPFGMLRVPVYSINSVISAFAAEADL